MSSTPTSPLPPAGQEAKYAYRYVNKTTGETFMFVRHFGQGAESAAQLVKNAATGEILVRKVVMSLFRREPHLFNTPFRPRPPKEIEILQEIHSWPDMPGVPRYFSQCYSHEYQKAKVSSYPLAGTLYRHVGLWKLCNGGAVIRNSQVAPGGTLAIRMTDEIPMAALGRFTWQIIGSLHFLGHGNPTGTPVQHRDAHPGNIFMHWTNGPVDLDNPSSLLPDFILGDFGEAEFQPIDLVDKYRQPLTTDVERIQHTFRMCLEELGLLMMEKTSNGPVWRKLQGPHRSSSLRLLDVSEAIDAMVEQEKMAHNQPYPNLMPLVKMGKEIEAMCLSGGVDAGLMKGDPWKKFVGERRAQALSMSTAPPFIVRANREQALRPSHPGTGGRLELFAPWTLCVSAWKVVQEGPTPATDPNACKYPDNKGFYTSDIVWDSLPVVEEDLSQPIQDDDKKGRIFEKLFILSAKTPGKIAAEGESFTVALDWHEHEGEQWQPSPPRTAMIMPGRFPVTESSSSEEPPFEPSSKSLSSPGLGAFRNEEELKALYEDMEALDAQFHPSSDEDDNKTKAPQFNPVAPVFVPKGPIEAANNEKQPQPEVPAFVPYGYTNGVDDYPQVTANIQLNKLLNNPDKVTNNPSEVIMKRLHRLVHPDDCTCDDWYLDIEDRLEMNHLSSSENSLESSLKGSSKETPETNKTTESSPLTVPDKSILDEKTPASSSPAASSVRRQQEQQRRTRLPVPIPSRQKAAAAETPTRPPPVAVAGPIAQIPPQTRPARPIQRPTVPARQATRPTAPGPAVPRASIPAGTRLAAVTNNRVAPAPRSPNVARIVGAFERRAAAAPAPAPRPGAVSRTAVRRDAGVGPGADNKDKDKKNEKRPAWRQGKR